MRKSLHVPLLIVCLVLACASLMAQRTAESRNMVLVGHNDLSRRSGAVAEAEHRGAIGLVARASRELCVLCVN